MATITAEIEYLTLRKVRAHYELYVPDEELDTFNELPRKIQEERIKDDGEIVVDDFSIDDIGDIYEINC